MNNPSARLATAHSSNWHDLYLLALFETDEAKLLDRMAQAELALLDRERELFADPDGARESERVNTALKGLRALKRYPSVGHPARA